MKNKIIYLSLIFLFHINVSFSQDQYFEFQTKTIEVLENGNLIKANFGRAISTDNDFEINANFFEYNNNSKILKINGEGLILIKSNNLRIKFDEGIIDQDKFIFEAYGKVKAKFLDGYLDVNSKKIIYDFKNKFLISPDKADIKYNYKNNIITKSFKYEINKNLLKIKDLNFTDGNNNNLKSSIAYINTKTNNLYGKNIFLNLNNETFNEKNEPRLKGNSIINNDERTEITKGVFTTCKKRDGCPPWELSANKIIHDKKNQTINYENAIIKIYDKPIAYFPKFSHPDPTVNRKSGFLTPSIKNSSNRKNYLSIPYYLVIADNRDFTFSPRFYDHEEILLRTEYRQAGYKSNHLSDFSFKINDDKKLRSHFFYKYNKTFDLDNFIDNNLDVKVQATSKDTYIKKNEIKSNLINNENILENSAKFSFFTEDMSANIETILYEDLDRNETDRFEYIVPKLDFTKKIFSQTNLNGDFTLKSQALARNYNTNIFETVNINDLIFESFPKISTKGFYNNYEFLLKNVNTDAQKSKSYKNKENVNVSGILQINSSLPLIKENNYYKNISTPKFSLKISPNHMKDIRNEDIKIDTTNIYSLNRAGKKDVIEGGLSLAYGNEFSMYNKQKSIELLNFKIANNLRLEENKDLPGNSQIGQKTSSILSEITYHPIKNIRFNYNTSIKNNLSDINYENLITEFKINNIVTSFDYLNQNYSSNEVSYVSNSTKLLLNNSSSFSFSTRRNKTIDLTEYYNLAYQYRNDCLTASIQYNKEYYNDRDLKPNEAISIKLTIIPFNNNSNF